MGDFNSRHISWGDTLTNKRGEDLHAFTVSQGLQCAHPNKNTFVSHNGGSVIDLSFMKGKIYSQYHSTSVDTDSELFTGAPVRGHLPVIHQFKLSTSVELNTSQLYQNLSKTDWKTWKHGLESTLCNKVIPWLNTYSEPFSLWSDFKDALHECNERFIPLSH